MRAWRIRGGGRGRIVAEDFWIRDFVALAWQEFGRSAEGWDRREIRAELEPRLGRQAAAIAAGHLYKFVNEVERGDVVITPTVKTRELLVGRVLGDYRHQPERLSDGNVYAHRRDVEWLSRQIIDVLPDDIKRTVDTQQALQEIRAINRLAKALGVEPG